MAYDWNKGAAYLSDILMGMGSGMLSRPQGAPPLAGFGMGLQNANQMLAARKQQETEKLREDMLRAQFQQTQEQIAEQKRVKDAQRSAFNSFLPPVANSAGFRPTGAGPAASANTTVNAAANPMLAGYSPEQIAALRALGTADAGSALNLITEQAFKSREAPKTQTFYDGNSQYEGYLTPDGQIVRLTENAPRWQPPQPPEMPGDYRIYLTDRKPGQSYGEWKRSLEAPEQPSSVEEFLYAKTPEGGNFPGTFSDWIASKKGQGFSVTTPDGTSVTYGTPPALKPPGEAQMQAGNRGQLVQDGLNSLDALYNDPNISALNVGIADTISGLGPIGRVASSEMKSDAEQQFSAAKAAALEGMAAAVTGAGVTKDQFDRFTQMLPDITDKPDARKAKMKAARNFLDTMLKNAGAAANPVNEKAPAEPMDLARIPEFTDPNDPALKALPSGSEFYAVDPATGQKKKRYVP